MKFEYSANKEKKRIMTERPKGSFSKGNVYYHEIKWYYGRSKDFSGISGLSWALISCLTLSSYPIFLSTYFLVCKMHTIILSDRLLWEINSTVAESELSHWPSVHGGCFILVSAEFTWEDGICPTTLRDQRPFGLPPGSQICST